MLISEFIELTKNLKGSTIIKMAYKRYDSPSETDKNSFNIDYYKDPCYHGVIEINEKSTEPITLSDIREGSYETSDELISENHISPSGFFVGKGSIIFY